MLIRTTFCLDGWCKISLFTPPAGVKNPEKIPWLQIHQFIHISWPTVLLNEGHIFHMKNVTVRCIDWNWPHPTVVHVPALYIIVLFLLWERNMKCTYFCIQKNLATSNPVVCSPIVLVPTQTHMLQYLNLGDCLEDKGEDYQNCSMLYCVP